jgi:hypothetical protein
MKYIKLFEQFITEAMNPTKKVINGIFRKNGIKTLSTQSSGMIKGWTTYHGKGYKYEYSGLITLKGFSKEEIEDLATQFREAGVEVNRIHTNAIEYSDLKESFIEEKELKRYGNELWNRGGLDDRKQLLQKRFGGDFQTEELVELPWSELPGDIRREILEIKE